VCDLGRHRWTDLSERFVDGVCNRQTVTGADLPPNHCKLPTGFQIRVDADTRWHIDVSAR